MKFANKRDIYIIAAIIAVGGNLAPVRRRF
jgi:hypothetical protein